MLFEATEKGVAAALVEDYLGIMAFYTLHTRWDFLDEVLDKVEDEETHQRLEEKVFRDMYGPILGMLSKKGSVVANWDSMEKEFGLLENRTSGAPFSIYPFHPQVAAALVCGYIRFFVFCDLNVLTRRFQNEGFQVNIEYEPVGREQQFPHIQLFRPKLFRDGTWGTMLFSLSKPLMQQILGEGLTFETVVNGVVKPSFRGQVKEHNATALAYKNEGTIWGRTYVDSSYLKPGTKTHGNIEF